jgi:elongation factor P
MKINGNAVRPGMVIEYKDSLWRVARNQTTQPGKGGAYNQVELKNLRDGTKLNERFRAAESVERAYLEQKKYQFLYADGEVLTLMEGETFEQIDVDAGLIVGGRAFLQDGMEVEVELFEDQAIGITLADTVTMEVVETEPVVKGQTAASSFKPAVVENGERIMVPPHIEAGTRVVINTADGTYAERAKD